MRFYNLRQLVGLQGLVDRAFLHWVSPDGYLWPYLLRALCRDAWRRFALARLQLGMYCRYVYRSTHRCVVSALRRSWLHRGECAALVVLLALWHVSVVCVALRLTEVAFEFIEVFLRACVIQETFSTCDWSTFPAGSSLCSDIRRRLRRWARVAARRLRLR